MYLYIQRLTQWLNCIHRYGSKYSITNFHIYFKVLNSTVLLISLTELVDPISKIYLKKSAGVIAKKNRVSRYKFQCFCISARQLYNPTVFIITKYTNCHCMGSESVSETLLKNTVTCERFGEIKLTVTQVLEQNVNFKAKASDIEIFNLRQRLIEGETLETFVLVNFLSQHNKISL